MRNVCHGGRFSVVMALALFCPVSASAQSPPDAEAPFLAETAAAMDRMMSDMETKPTGNVDRDFAAMMIPHHQGAIDMAQALLRYGQNEQLRRIAQEIIVEQQQEIAVMQLAVGRPVVPPPAAIAQPANSVAPGHPPLAHSMNMQQER